MESPESFQDSRLAPSSVQRRAVIQTNNTSRRFSAYDEWVNWVCSYITAGDFLFLERKFLMESQSNGLRALALN
jgi:hypothetical protein